MLTRRSFLGVLMNIITIPLDRWPGQELEYKYNERTLPIRYIVLHTTGGTDSRNWLSKWNKANSASEQNNVSIHYLVQRDGLIYKIIDDTKRAWHVGKSKMPDGETDGNSASIGIEIEHLNEPDFTEKQLQSVAELVNAKMQEHRISGEHVVSHASVALPLAGQPGGPRKIDPVHFDWADMFTRISVLEAHRKPVEKIPYTEYTLMISTPEIDAGKLTEYLVHKHAYKNYAEDAIREILGYYMKYGKQIGVNYLFAIAQMIHETGWLDSWWAARPRRNPAGIGVSGQSTAKNPNDAIHWAQSGNIWLKGQSFKSWDIAVQHHLARLLLYALKDDEMTPEQLAFSEICLDRKNLDRIRGVGKQFIGLNGVWAVPGKTYSQKIVTIMNSFITASQ